MNERMHVGQGFYNGNGVTYFPVWLESEPLHGVCWNTEHLTIGENESGATVNSLTVTNSGHRPHVVLEGDIFEGGWQNRLVTRTQIIKRGESLEVPVVCVEEGRWHGETTHRSSVRRAPVSVRRQLNWHRSSLNAPRDQEGAEARLVQDEIWDAVRDVTRGEFAGESLTMAMDAHHERNRSRGTSGIRRTPRVLPGQRGVIVAAAHSIVTAEFFGSQKGLESRWQAIIDATEFSNALPEWGQTPAQVARDLIADLERGPIGERLDTPVVLPGHKDNLIVSSYANELGFIYASVIGAGHPMALGV